MSFKRSDTIVELSQTVYYFLRMPGAGAKHRKLRIHRTCLQTFKTIASNGPVSNVETNPAITAQLITRRRCGVIIFALLILLSPMSPAQSASVTSPAPGSHGGSASRGESLFTGKTQFRNGGPTCISCHSIAGVSVPNEGTIGPNLTASYAKLGPSGIKAKIQPPYGGVMSAVYSDHALVSEEQMDLLAFLKQKGTPSGMQGSVPLNSAQLTPAASPTPEMPPGSPSRGESLFTGRTDFLNRGPACISCHSIAGLSFPNGGTLGPDLTHTYTRLGPRGTEAALQTLYFGVMAPIYGDHPLAPEEQRDLMAFFKQSETRPETQWNTRILILIAIPLSAFFIALTGFLWKDRVRSVRRALVARATGQGARR